MATTLHVLPLQYTESPDSATPSNVYNLSPVANVITLPKNTHLANVTLTASAAYTLANPTTLVDGQKYVVRIEVPTAGIGSTLAVGTNWIAVDGSSVFDASANGDVNLIVGECMAGKIYYRLSTKSAA
jgi:hypothetical protein